MYTRPREPTLNPVNPQGRPTAEPDAAPSPLLAEALLDVVRRRLGEAARAWLDEAAAGVRPPLEREAFAASFTAATRRVGKAVPTLEAEERARLGAAGLDGLLGETLDQLARAALLLRVGEAVGPAALPALVDDVYQHGDSRERQAILRTLTALPDPARFLPLAIDACRTAIQPLFEAIACENAYPAAHFPEPSFNQMVLKALFLGVDLRRIVRLADRVTPELRRMAADYASERRAAGRSVPDDVDRLLGRKGAGA